ncbi:S-glutathionyl-(chloro)hydroquinone reductase [Podospora pseudocomata]|uniref:S-glutathionyl-(Chloro)hydroquinone reductase n=1 Tax=Podospora pseudocomata TaxID=2093779 RepID=A0ABR0GJ27_9PEZI|nr:S-glutathionyl-(chloro)hydroquinone reductase [Podospora pseudocomata]
MSIRSSISPLLRGTAALSHLSKGSFRITHSSSFTSSIKVSTHRYLSTTTNFKMAAQDTPSGKEVQKDDNVITNWVNPSDKSGEFKRQQSTFRSFISSSPGSEFPPEAGRYHLYVSYACPWANRTLIARKLKGLEDIISFSVVHWHMGPKGWRFVTDEEAEQEDVKGEGVVPHEGGLSHLREVYFGVNPEYEGRFTVPVLWDKKGGRIVNNESSEILRMLNSEFNGLIDEPFKSVDLYPEDLRREIDETHEWQYDLINNGVYKSGFATTQEAYERNVKALFEALDRAEKHLADGTEGPYWFGERLTEVDIRLFVTIVRFDPVYVQHFKCNIRDIRSGYPAIHKWMRNLYWNIPAFKDTTNFNHIKFHYTKSHTNINPLSITPLGPVPDILPRWEEVPAVSFRG